MRFYKDIIKVGNNYTSLILTYKFATNDQVNKKECMNRE